MPDFATRWWGSQYEVIRRGPARETRHKAWALDVTDDGGRFDPKADLRPGDIVAIKHGRGRAAERVIDTVAPSIADPYQRVTWRPPTGAPSALALTDLHSAVQKAAAELYAGGHYATAIEAATKALEVAVREQSGLPAGGNLMGRAFADDGPLDVHHHEGVTGKDEQTGFRFLYMGAATALRNPRHHEFITDDPVSALEHLALISLLLRRLDTASIRPEGSA
jgi:uncharacterized protein (TIGR02391 family)